MWPQESTGKLKCLTHIFTYMWYRLAAAAPIWPLAWESPYTAVAALKKKKKKKRQKKLVLTQSEYITKIIESRNVNRYLYTYIPRSISHSSQKVEATHVSINGWLINQMWSILTMKCYPRLKTQEILTRATTWMNLENIMLSERIQTQKDRYDRIPLTWGTWSHQIHRERKQDSDYQGLQGARNGGLVFNGSRVSVLQDEKSSDGGDGCTTVWIHYNITELYT